MSEFKPKVLFVIDKWCAGEKKYGESEFENNLFFSLKTTQLAIVDRFHYDEFYDQHKELGDKAFINKCMAFNPSLICLVIYRKPGSSVNTPTFETLLFIKEKLKIPILSIWGQTDSAEQIEISKSILPYVNLNIATPSSTSVARINKHDKYVYLWVPKDNSFFNNKNKGRDIEISYVGSSKHERMKVIRYLRENGVSVYSAGGEREQHLSKIEYADLLQRSKITLSFSRSSFSHVTNARTFEAMSCGAMVMEQAGIETAKLFEPFVDYVPFYSKNDLLEKVRYYLKNGNELMQIAASGYNKYQAMYTADRFWSLVFDYLSNEKFKLGINTESDNQEFFYGHKLDLPFGRLFKLGWFRVLNFKIINFVHSNSIFYKIFFSFMKLLFQPQECIKSGMNLLPKRVNLAIRRFLGNLKLTIKNEILYRDPEKLFKHYYDNFAIINFDLWAKLIPDVSISNYDVIPPDATFVTISQDIHLEKTICLSIREMWNIYNWVRKTESVFGDIAEVGVYKGGSAKIICEAKKNKNLHLFDTFTGLPEKSDIDNLNAGDICDDSLADVTKYLAKYENVFYYPGIFPDSAQNDSLKKTKYSFIHLDVDTYNSTKACLEYFYPKMSAGGVIISHDYRCKHLPGVKLAIDEFFADKLEIVIELWDTQALIIKV